jgi:hypothetical protein
MPVLRGRRSARAVPEVTSRRRGRLRRFRPGRRFALVTAVFAAYATSDLWGPRVQKGAGAVNSGARGIVQDLRARRSDRHTFHEVA